MNRHERLSTRQRERGFGFGLMALMIPLVVSMLQEQVLFKAPKGVSLEAHFLAGSKSKFKDKEKIPIDPQTNALIIPSGATAEIIAGKITYCIHDFTRFGSAQVKRNGLIRRGSNTDEFRMMGGDSVELDERNFRHTFDDNTLVAWRP